MTEDLFAMVATVGMLGHLDTVALCECWSDLKQMIPYSTSNGCI